MEELIKDSKVITPELHSLLKMYVKSDDPLEDPNFDAVAYLNEKFSDEKSLDKLPGFIEDLENSLFNLDEEIDNLVCERASYNDEMKTYMNELNDDMSKIIELISNIKNNADISETTVKMICTDIKSLDNARNNIQTTVSSLKKLIMLITGIEKLESFVKNKEYKEAANAIEASNDILDFFKEYKHIKQIAELSSKKDNLCSSLLGLILDEFKQGAQFLPNAKSELLYDACLAINAIGDHAIMAIKEWFTSYILTPYEELFNPHKEDPVKFEETDKRFSWIKRVLREYNQKFEIVIPASWGFKFHLCSEFCRITKLHINDILQMNMEDQRSKKVDVVDLIRILNDTIVFETNLKTYLDSEYENFNKKLSSEQENNNLLNLTNFNNQQSSSSVEEIKEKYEVKPVERRKDPNSKPKYNPFRIKGVISESFEPYMITYVRSEESKLKETIDDLSKKDKIDNKLFVSSLHLFNNIKNSMKRCLTFSNTKPFFDLSKIIKEVIRYYLEIILNQKMLRFKEFDKLKLNDDEIKILCYVVNTCDYCFTTINALVESLRDKIDDKFKNQIHYDDILDSVKLTQVNSLDYIITSLKNVANENLQQMVKLSWVNIRGEEDTSPYMQIIIRIFDNSFNIIKPIISEVNFNYILFKMPSRLIDLIFYLLYKIKRMDESGAQKLTVDLKALKKLFSSVYPNKGGEVDINVTILNNILTKDFNRIEMRLMCISSLNSEIGKNYINLVPDKSKEDFDKLLSLKDVNKKLIPDYDKLFTNI